MLMPEQRPVLLNVLDLDRHLPDARLQLSLTLDTRSVAGRTLIREVPPMLTLLLILLVVVLLFGGFGYSRRSRL
jgi:type VI protein secretion system component VasF